TMLELASHIANIVRFGDLVLNSDNLDFSKPGAMPPATYASSDELLKTFDRNAAASRKAIESIDDKKLGETWTLRRGEQVMMAMPRAAAVRALLMSHTIHHRGQLSAYFRLTEVPHPSLYGQTSQQR